MAYQVQLPDGSLGWIDDSVPQSKALEVARKAYPDAFPPPPGVISQLVSAPKEFVKGAASGIVQAVGGLGALPYAAARYAAPELKPFEETGFGKAITGAEQYLAPSDEGAVTQLAGGLGSFASIFGPQALLRGVGGAGRLATGVAPRAAAPVAVGQVSGLGVEEARQRAAIARGEGVEVSPGEELAALATGVPIGLTELLPVERLFKGLGAGLDGAFKYDVANLVKRGFKQGGIEGAQEVAAGLMQDLSAKGIYNPDLQVGESMLGEFALGAGVGAIAQTGLDVLLRKDIQRAYQGRLNKESQDRINRETEALRLKNAEEIATTKKNLGIPESQPLALPAPSKQIEDTEQVDPLMNPVGFFNANELTPDYLKAVNNIRDKEGKSKLSQFSIEDLADAGAPQAEIDRLLTYKTGYNEQDQKIKLEAQDVFNLATEKNVDVTTPGFADFLRRSTGQADLNKMSQPQLFSAFKALDGLESSDVLRILPQGTNSTRFTQEQYDKTIKNIATLFPSTNLLGRSSVLKEIKDYSGLENDRDAESLLQTAIRKGDLATVSSPRYEVLDRTGKVVRVYNTRKSAEDAAARDGLSVREGTSINVALPGDATQLPGGPDIRKGTFQEGVAPAGFEIRSDDAVLSTSKDEKEASDKADRLQRVRESKALGFLGQAQKIENEIEKSNRKLESMEADGKADTLEYKKLSAKIANNNKNLQNQADRLKTKAKSYSQPLQVSAKGEKPVGREGYTLFEAGKPVATFPNQQAAEEAALTRLDDETLQKIATLGRFQKGLMPKRLSAMARQEMERRSGGAPKGIGVEITGTREEAEAKLAEAGIFTGDLQKAADELNKKLRPMMDKLGLGDLRLNILNAIKTDDGKSANGYYVKRLIAIALDAENPIRALRHEAIHALKELGAFTPEQWRVLENKAKSDWINKYDIRRRYAGQGLTEADMIEEAISDAFSDFDQTKPPPGMIGSLFRKTKQFMEALGNGIRGLGFETSDSVFKRVEEGGLSKIEATTPKVSEEPPEETQEVPINTQTPGEKYSVKQASPEVLEEADRYFEANGILPYTEQTITSVDVEASPKKFSIKREGKYGNHDVLGIPVNKNGTVTLYFPADNESAREVMRSRKLLPAAGADRIYLTNESSEKIVLGNPGNIEQQVGGANVLVQIDPGMLQIDQEYENGRIDFFIPVKEGKAFFDKMKLTKLFTLEGARNKGFNTDRTLNEVGDSISASASAYMGMNSKQKREALKVARQILKTEHNIGTLLGENGKLEKTRVGDYGLTYEGQSVASLGLGLASAQSLNTQERVTTCPKSAICEGLCLGDTSGQNQLYGGEDEFRQGPRLSQYLKTEALMLNPKAFGIVLAHEIQSFANKAKQMDYQPAIRLNVTSDIPPKVYKEIIDLFPNVMFYDYTKLYGNDSIAPNHHITYSSSGISQVVNGELIVNKFSTWDKDVKKLLSGKNVAMAFTSRNAIPNFVIDEKTGNKFEVWNGDNYDARFLDPKRDDGIGYIIGLTNKDRTTKPEEAAKKHGGFFFDYDQKRDGDTLVVQDQSKLNQGTEQPIKFLSKPKAETDGRKFSLRAPETPEFKKWFKSSKVVDDNGKPLIMYHGTPSFEGYEFKPFENKNRAGNIDGYYFTSKVDDANDYAGLEEGAEVIPAYLSIKNPYVPGESPVTKEMRDQYFKEMVSANKHMSDERAKEYAQSKIYYLDKNGIPLINAIGNDGAAFQRIIKAGGYDGYQDGIGSRHWVAFESNQVKSAFNQKPTESPDIRYSLRQTDTPEFKKWFGNSKILNDRDTGPVSGEDVMDFLKIPQNEQRNYWENLSSDEIGSLINDYRNRKKIGAPKIMYHGTARDITEFRPKQANAIFLTDSPKFAEDFTGMSENYMADEFFKSLGEPEKSVYRKRAEKISKRNGTDYADELLEILKEQLPSRANIMPVYVRAENPFDYENRDVVKQLINEIKNLEDINALLESVDIDSLSDLEMLLRGGNWGIIEEPEIQRLIKKMGFDSFYVMEGFQKNLAVYDPNQIKSAIGNIGTFSREDKDIRFSLRDTIDPATAQSIDRTTTVRKDQGFGERMAEAVSPTAFQRFRQGMINKYESIERLSQDIAKQFGSNELLADTSAIAAALFSDRAAGVAASSFRNGVPVYNKGFTSVSDFGGQVKGLIPILEPLAKYGDPYVFQAFQFYAATQRGKRLTAEGREKLFTPTEIQQGSLLAQQYPEFKQVFDEYQKYNKGLVDFMKDTGVLSEEEAKVWTQNWDYIPFYRQMDGEEVAGPRVFSAIAGVAKPKKLKGGEAPLADFMETVVRNSRAAIEAGMKNVAMQRVVRDVMRLNQGEFVPAPLAKGADIVTVKENGKTKHYRMDDPLLVQALHGLNLPQLPFLEILAKPAEVLRNLVTKDPGFMLANLMRDSLQAWVTTGTNIIPIADTFKQYGQALADTSPEARALANGGLFAGYDFGGDVKSTAREVEAELRKRSGQRTAFETATLPLSKMWELLDKGSSVSDVATRAEVYKRTLAETGNEAEALYQAMEVLNFSRKGNSALIRILTAVVPFMNARIQGLDVLYRAGFGKMATATKERQQKAFVTRGLTLFALSSMYWMMASDTEEYKTAEPEVRDNNWIIGNVRIPIPFEIGTVFKVFPERIYEYFFGMDTGRDLKDSIVRNITSTLAFNPIPQAILPVVENVVNYSFFTGQPIVGKGMQDVAKPYQATPGTSLLAQQIADATGQSPIMIDNLIRGYTGTIGTYAVMALDSIMRGEGDPTKATMKAEQLPVIKRFFASPESTGSVTAYYDLKNRVDEAVRTVNFLERTGGIQDLQEYMKDKGAKLLSIQPYIQTLDKEITMLREFRRAVNLSQMEPDRKRQTLDSIRTAEVQMTSRIQYLKKMID